MSRDYNEWIINHFGASARDLTPSSRRQAAQVFYKNRAVKGGENLRLRLNFPVAAGVNDFDIVMLMIAPSFAEWGEFTDNYAGSAAEAIDTKYAGEFACGNGALWETMLVE